MAYIRPDTVQDALSAARSGARLVAGATDWFPAIGEGRPDGDVLDLTGIAELRGIRRTDGAWRIGATTTWSDILHADLPGAFDGLKAAAREVGSIQIQNAATVAGNLCNASPAADGVPPLLTLDAQVEIAGTDGRRSVPLAEFLTGPRRTALGSDEIVTAVTIPPLPEAKSAFVKLGSRRYLVISIAMVAVLVSVRNGLIDEARISVGACSPVAVRLGDLERDLSGRPVADLAQAGLVRPQHLSALAPIDDIRATAEYRVAAAGQLVGRALRKACGG